MASSGAATTYSYPPQGKTAIVTGGSSGIGKSSAKHLALAGWNVVITGRREERLKAAGIEIQDAVQASGKDRKVKVAYIVGDVTKEQDVVKWVRLNDACEYGRADQD